MENRTLSKDYSYHLKIVLGEKLSSMGSSPLETFIDEVRREYGVKGGDLGTAVVYQNPEDQNPRVIPAIFFEEPKKDDDYDSLVIIRNKAIGWNSFSLYTYRSH